MQYEVEVNGEVRTIAITRAADGRFVVRTDRGEWKVDASRVTGQLLSLLIERNGTGAVESRELLISPDPVTGQVLVAAGAAPVPVTLNTRRRWARRGDEAHAGGGPLRIVAPMPGKVVRIAAAAGTPVARRQPVVVIEAMKMENELRASHAGTVSEVLVQEGQLVEAGTLLAIVIPA